MGIGRYQLVWDWNSFHDFNALGLQCIMLHVAHGNEAVEPPQAEPMDRIGHQLLEPGVLHSGYAFGALEIGRRLIAALLALARIVDEELGDLAKRAALFAIIDDNSEPAGLGRPRAFLDAVNQVGAAGADVGAEYVGTVAFIMDSAGDLGTRIGKFLDVAEQVDGGAADRRQKYAHVGTSDEFGEHARGLLEQGAPQSRLGRTESLRNTRQVPDRIDGDFHHREGAALDDVLSVGLQPTGPDGIPHFREIESRAGDGNCGANILSFGDLRLERGSGKMAPGVERDNAPRLRPLRKRTDGSGRVGICQIGTADRIEHTGRDRQRAIERVGAAMAADYVSMLRLRHRRDDRTACMGVRCSPTDREARLSSGLRMGGQANVIGSIGVHSEPVHGKKSATATRRQAGSWGFAKGQCRIGVNDAFNTARHYPKYSESHRLSLPFNVQKCS